MSITNKDDFTIRLMTEHDSWNVQSILQDHFNTGEPLIISSGENVQIPKEKRNNENLLSTIREGTSLVAFDEKNPDQILGLVLAVAQYPSDLEKNRKEAEERKPNIWGRIARMLSKMELEADVFKRYGVSKVLNSYITVVHTSVRGKGLGTKLAAALIEVGRSKGFPMMIAYCTSFYTARQKEALGMECIHTLTYADYKDEEGRVIFQPPALHEQVKLMVMKL